MTALDESHKLGEVPETNDEPGARQAPIFVVGASRSGTNLLRAILNNHSQLWVSGETHYFDDLRPRLGRDAVESLDEQAQARTEHYFLALAHRPYGWGGNPDESPIDAGELRRLAQEAGGSGDAYFAAFCALRASHHGKPRWAEKTPRHVYRIDEILSAFPSAKVICLIRDPRAVTASFRDWHRVKRKVKKPDFASARAADQRRTKKSYNIVLVTLLWRSVVRSSYSAFRRHGAERVYLQRFEGLTLEPQGAVQQLCDWLGLQYEPEMLGISLVNSSYTEKDEPTGISREPVDRWRTELSPREVAIVQRCCGGLMDTLGYEREPVRVSTLGYAWAWATLLPATVRATVANRMRLGRVFEYVLRRAAPALSRRSIDATAVRERPDPPANVRSNA